MFSVLWMEQVGCYKGIYTCWSLANVLRLMSGAWLFFWSLEVQGLNQDHDGTKALELAGFDFLGLAPEGGHRVQSFLVQAAEALVEGEFLCIHVPFFLQPIHTQYKNINLKNLKNLKMWCSRIPSNVHEYMFTFYHLQHVMDSSLVWITFVYSLIPRKGIFTPMYFLVR